LEGGAATGRFTCPYHGWQYNIDGKLAKAIKMKGCEGFSAKDFSLRSLPVKVVGPWIYVNLGKDSSSLIENDLSDLSIMTKMLEETKYTELQLYKSRKYEINCNWKVLRGFSHLIVFLLFLLSFCSFLLRVDLNLPSLFYSFHIYPSLLIQYILD
jgi:phenylpropionate dioxygenase-like ring-hydroxylating dioxygenase large terminal subunit